MDDLNTSDLSGIQRHTGSGVVLRVGELTIYEAGEPQEFDIEGAQRAITCLPGRLCVAPDKPRETYGSILLPETTSEKERPDCGTAAVVGAAKRLQSGELATSPSVSPGDRVMLRPCKGKWVRDFQSQDGSFGLPEVRFYGVSWRLEDEILAVLREGIWCPLFDWIFIRRDSNETSSGIFIANPGNKLKKQRAEVVACNPGHGVQVGDIVLCDESPNAGLGFAHGTMGELEIIKCVNEDGFRQVWAILDDGSLS